jgi:DNA adenine methylase
MFLHIQPQKWIINDVNKDLMNIWKSIKLSKDEVVNIIKKFKKHFEPLAKPDKIAFCREQTSRIPEMGFDIVRATTYMLMKLCSYTGNILINGKYYFTGLEMAICTKRPIYFLSEKYFSNLNMVNAYMKSSKGKIYNKDYKFILQKAKKGDFVFLDPPYIENHEYSFNYNQNETLDNQFITDIHNEVKKLDKIGVKWLMTQADNLAIRKTFKKYKIISYPVYRGYRKTFTNELIIKNY